MWPSSCSAVPALWAWAVCSADWAMLVCCSTEVSCASWPRYADGSWGLSGSWFFIWAIISLRKAFLSSSGSLLLLTAVVPRPPLVAGLVELVIGVAGGSVDAHGFLSCRRCVDGSGQHADRGAVERRERGGGRLGVDGGVLVAVAALGRARRGARQRPGPGLWAGAGVAPVGGRDVQADEVDARCWSERRRSSAPCWKCWAASGPAVTGRRRRRRCAAGGCRSGPATRGRAGCGPRCALTRGQRDRLL